MSPPANTAKNAVVMQQYQEAFPNTRKCRSVRRAARIFRWTRPASACRLPPLVGRTEHARRLKSMHQDLSTGWSFVPDRTSRRRLGHPPDPNLPLVDLPHSWNEHDTFQEGVVYRQGWGTYQREFTVPSRPGMSSGTRWHLCSEGFYGTGDIYLNGRLLASVDGRYIGFREDVTALLRTDDINRVAVRLNNRSSRGVLPGIRDPDFLLHGGLSGRVWMECLPAVHFLRDDFWCSGRIHETVGTARCAFSVVNTGNTPARLSAHAVLRDSDGATLSEQAIRLEIGPGNVLSGQEILLPAAPLKPWSPDSPCLYLLSVSLVVDGRACDELSRHIGFRSAEFRPGAGFFLNGERVELHGCNRHESIPGFGQALPASLHMEDAVRIRRLGLNFVRLSHYPQHPAFLDACDRQGLLVYAEIATWKSVRGYGAWLRAACRQMRDMILRDRSHPSIILWGMGNEARSRRAYRKLQSIAAELDPDRPTTYAENHLHRARRSRTTGIPDVWGSNYELDLLAEGAAASRLNVAVVSEMSNYPPGVRGDRLRELEQVALIETDIKRLGSDARLAGFALWCWNDYATIRKDRYFRHCGIVDAWRMAKPSAWLMEAMYSQRPFLRLCGDWSKACDAEERDIHVFTNRSRVTFSLNGMPVAELNPGQPHAIVRVKYQPESLTAVAEGTAGPIRFSLPAHGAAVRLLVEPEMREGSAADRDTVPFIVRTVDSEGNTAEDQSGHVTVTVTGPGRLRAYTPRNEVRIGAGVGRGFITSTGAPGTATVTASHPYLASGNAAIAFA